MQDAHETPKAWRWTLGFLLVASVLAMLQRVTPHPFNFVMIGALGLWAGARLRSWGALFLPVAVWAITDVIDWLKTGYPAFNPFVAAGFTIYALLGLLLLRNTRSAARIAGVCVLGSVQFFLLTNFSVWLRSAFDPANPVPAGRAYYQDAMSGEYAYPRIWYAPSVEGLGACYVMALPFYGQDPVGNPVVRPLGFAGNLLTADLIFAALLFGTHALILAYINRPVPVPVRRNPQSGDRS